MMISPSTPSRANSGEAPRKRTSDRGRAELARVVPRFPRLSTGPLYSHHFSVLALPGLAMLLAACATGGVVHVPATENSASGGQVRVVNERGAVSPQAARRIEQEGPTDLLAHHLREVEGVIESPLVLGNDAHLLIDGPQTYSAMFEAIEHAKSRVFVETYIIEAGKVGGDLAELLAKKRARGVEVRVLYDSVGSRPTPAEYFDRLRGAGIAVCEFNPINPLKLAGDADLGINNRDHRKVLVVDGRVAFTGGINISGSIAPDPSAAAARRRHARRAGRDTHVMMRGPIVAQFEGLFATPGTGRRGRRRGAAGFGAPRSGRRHGDARRRRRPGVAAQRTLCRAAVRGRAREGAYLAHLRLLRPGHRVLDALQDAAKRGVDVRLVLPGFSDFWAPFHAGRSHYTALLRAGVRVFERRDALLHAKTAVIDSVWSSVGSTNLDWRSFVHNYEADLLVLDRDFAGEMEALFSMDEKASHEVKMVEWKNRGLKARVLEWFARRWEYLL